MKTFILILLFGKLIFLTDSGINIKDEWYLLKLQKPIKALNNGASIILQLPIDGSIVKSIDPKGNIFLQLESLLPKDTITAKLINKKSTITLVNYHVSIGDFSLKQEGSVFINLTGNISPDIEYDSIMIKSKIPLNNIKVGWKNYSL